MLKDKVFVFQITLRDEQKSPINSLQALQNLLPEDTTNSLLLANDQLHN